ncbi:sugar phosphate isomerase/epimerase and 4-hydroxyphenylpyruvate domain-containing protein [Tomitella gaofuii]|uniref:sugar phosphate isomerase/epimerase and 4-hydroxyphenylpyruvate domain-containing protein n=1 Tax=Tomitella gaofuii TaxID=2760083 RepID=UPI0015FB3AB4|nr:sugar phosphate isomerase/epimerase and 4-hydroxyphenylpyruvate domain-containing protein [Tomitella gaofuii]
MPQQSELVDAGRPARARTSIATVSLSGGLEDKLDAIAAAGFDGVEIFEPDLISTDTPPEGIASRAADLGLSIDLYQPFRDADSADPDRFARNLQRAERKFALMERLGCDTLLVCSSPLETCARDDALIAEQLHTLAERAHRRGIKLAYEALAWGTHVADYRHAWRIVADADHPALGTCLDSFHILSRGDDPSGIRGIPGDKIFFLQLADAPRKSMDVLQWSRHYRNFPGQGGFDLADFARHVRATGYQGPWSLEIFNDVFRWAPTGRTAVDAHRSLVHLQEQTALRGDPAPAGTPALAAVPPRPSAGEAVSVRIAAGPDRAEEMGAALTQIGFHLVGRHREADLQLWRHGRLAVVLDATDGTVWTAPGVPAQLPTLTQIGVRTGDPEGWRRRAEAFGVPAGGVTLPGAVDADDAQRDVVRVQLTEAVSVDMRAADSAEGWRAAFELYPGPLAAAEAEHAGAASSLTGVDHIALPAAEDGWESATLLMRSVFGMRPHEGVDVTDAVGLMRSQALTMADGREDPALRISLNRCVGTAPCAAENVPAVRRGGVGHVAFSCTDIFAVAEALRARGRRPLAVSPNYYEDLAARFDLSGELLERMREFGVLYDVSRGPAAPGDPAAAGEFFHLFTPTVGADLFFEVVQRIGGYDAYGEVNTPVRVAAQLRER